MLFVGVCTGSVWLEYEDEKVWSWWYTIIWRKFTSMMIKVCCVWVSVCLCDMYIPLRCIRCSDNWCVYCTGSQWRGSYYWWLDSVEQMWDLHTSQTTFCRWVSVCQCVFTVIVIWCNLVLKCLDRFSVLAKLSFQEISFNCGACVFQD